MRPSRLELFPHSLQVLTSFDVAGVEAERSLERRQRVIDATLPHPDDAEFGIAGTMARWTREGKDAIYVVCTNGDKGTSDANMKPDELARIREQEQLAA